MTGSAPSPLVQLAFVAGRTGSALLIVSIPDPALYLGNWRY